MIIRIASAFETRSAAAVLTHTAVVTSLEVIEYVGVVRNG